MKRNLTLGALLAAAVVAPAVVAPRVMPQAQAQPAAGAPAEYPDVPRNHWAYDALNKLSQAGVIEGRPGGNYVGNEPMTRYEFAVAIARLLERIKAPDQVQPYNDTELRNRITTLEGRPVPDIFRADVVELINALRNEFRDELNRLGARVDTLEGRVTALENRVPAPPKQTLSLGLLHRAGYANYINAGSGIIGDGGVGARNIVFGNTISTGTAVPLRPGGDGNAAAKRFSYTDLELRFTDRVTDRLSATAAIRSLGSTQEDPWTGDTGSSTYVRELYAVADLSDRSIIGIKGLTLSLGRQRTKIAQGLLYDNQFAPTDQIHGMFKLGPIAFNAFTGSVNNQTASGGFFGGGLFGTGNNVYLSSGSSLFLSGLGNAASPFVGFADGGTTPSFAEDNESLVHASANLFKLAGQPVQIGATAQFDGVANQKGVGYDLTIPLFNRTVGFEYVRQGQYADGSDPQGSRNPGAYIVTVPLLRTSFLDLDGAYGRANDGFQYYGTSAANPYARTYGEAIFDRPMFLGAPLINDQSAGDPQYLAAKRGYDFSGTARIPLPIIRKIPLDFRFYKAKGSADINLGKVYTVGTTFNLTPGLDLELKYGRYNTPGDTNGINYYRIGANLGF